MRWDVQMGYGTQRGLDQNFPRTILSLERSGLPVYKALFPFEMERQSLVGSLDLRLIFRPFVSRLQIL